MRAASLSRILDQAVQYALLSGLAGCAAKATDGNEPGVSQGDVSVNPSEADEPETTTTNTESQTGAVVEAGGTAEPLTMKPTTDFETLPCTSSSLGASPT